MAVELILIRNYPGMPFRCYVRRVTYRDGIAGFVRRGRWHEIAEALYSVSVKTLMRFGR